MTLLTSGQDRYGRVLAEVYFNGQNINKEMVRLGYAWAYREYLTDQDYIILEQQARAQSIGLWSQPNAIYPQNFRRHSRNKQISQAYKITSSTQFSCTTKRFCKEMNSCIEAKFYLNQCGIYRLDGDNDGIPL